jgi:hypothetical protein
MMSIGSFPFSCHINDISGSSLLAIAMALYSPFEFDQHHPIEKQNNALPMNQLL